MGRVDEPDGTGRGRAPTAPESPTAPSGCGPEATSADWITLVGLVLEVAGGLRRTLAPALEEQIGVGGQSFEILVRLSRSPGGRLRLADLAAQTGLTPSGLTRALDRLVEVGLVTREACCDDRRGAFAILTPSGAERMAGALARHERDIDALLDGVLDTGERTALVELLRKMRDRVHAGATAGSCEAGTGPDVAEVAGGGGGG